MVVLVIVMWCSLRKSTEGSNVFKIVDAVVALQVKSQKLDDQDFLQ